MPKSPVRRAEHRRTAVRLRELDEELKPFLAEIAAARAALVVLTGDDVTLDERRAAHRRLRLAYLAADAALRQATREARTRSRYEWMRMRARLSALDTARQQHLMAERDELPALALGSVRAVDTGMSGPAIGFHLHGRSRAPGTPARYGVDVEAVLRTSEGPAELEAEVPPGPEVSTTGSTDREGSTDRPREDLVTAS
ncbi:MAG TPA: hypothetical protein VFK52_05680 [Nocardioidaceae bacterium]|nr:hypothetical protein [Nocardioidaceae bacterium]